MTVSVIIPFYNLADYVRETLASVLDAPCAAGLGLEVIAVDDGSTDGTGARLDDYRGKVKVLHQPNGGEGSARNAGLKAATGEWVTFLDGDDVWLKPMLTSFAEVAGRHPDADIIGFRFAPFEEGALPPTPQVSDNAERVFDTHREIPSEAVLDLGVFPTFFRRAAFRDVSFSSLPLGADRLYVAHCLAKANCIVMSPRVVHGYRVRAGSMARAVWNERKIRSMIDFAALSLGAFSSSGKRVGQKGLDYLHDVLKSVAPKQIRRMAGDKTAIRRYLHEALSSLGNKGGVMKKEYDFAFSLGFSCGCTQALRAAGCQFASYPLDWVGTPDLATSVDAVVCDFARWMEYDDMRLVDVSHDAGFCTRAYLNDHTGFGFSHEFSDFRPFAASFPDVQASYAHRIARFREGIGQSKRILAVYLEHTTRERLPDEALLRQVSRLRAKYPSAVVDVLYFYEDPSCAEPRIVRAADGVTVVAADYRQMEDGKVTQYVKVELIARFLHERIGVVDRRTDTEKQKFAADRQVAGNGRWGYDKSAFRRWLNQRAYKLYRHLEGVLRKKGLIHPKRSVWFWDERWCREHGRTMP